MAHRVAVMRHGVLQQVGTPQELYERPANLFVADFIGSPAMNFLRGSIVHGDGGPALAYGRKREGRLELRGGVPHEASPGAEVIVGIRPEHLSLANGATRASHLPGTVTFAEPLGGDTIVHVQIAAPAVVTEELREVMLDVDETALEELERADVSRFVMLLRSTRPPLSGSSVELALDDSNLYFFDPADGRALQR
jgi:multiple sugar transport system ATP-binding protein